MLGVNTRAVMLNSKGYFYFDFNIPVLWIIPLYEQHDIDDTSEMAIDKAGWQ